MHPLAQDDLWVVLNLHVAQLQVPGLHQIKGSSHNYSSSHDNLPEINVMSMK